MVLAERKWWEKWASTTMESRPADYEALKKKWAASVKKVAIKLFPGIKDRIDFMDISTPLTIEHYRRASP